MFVYYVDMFAFSKSNATGKSVYYVLERGRGTNIPLVPSFDLFRGVCSFMIFASRAIMGGCSNMVLLRIINGLKLGKQLTHS